MRPVIATTSSEPRVTPAVDPRLVLSLAAVYLIWSSTYLAMRVAVLELPPLRDWLRIVPIGALLFVGGNGFVAVAEQSVGSGGAAVVCATMPLWVGVFGRFFGERVTGREWLSLVVGFVGVVVLMGGPSLAGRPEHIVLLCFSPVMWALGSLLARRTKDIGGEHATLVGPALQMLTGAPMLVVAAAVHGESLHMHASTGAWLSLAYLFVFGSVIGFTAYAWLLRNARPVVATSYAYVNPILAVLIGAALSNERLGWTTLIANVLIVGAIILALRKPASP